MVVMGGSRVRHGLTAALLALALAGCGEDPPISGDAARESGAPASPTAVPAAEGEVRTRGAVTVVETGDGPVACLGPVALSEPPQCSGQPLQDWRWSAHPEHQRSGGVRWGAFELRGTWDGSALRVTEAVPAAQAPAESREPDLATTCPEPDGGWVVDPSRAGDRALDAALTAAGRLADHAETWVDPANDVLNVRVTEDVAGAEAELRRVWGGGLCVAGAQYGEDALVDLAAHLQQQLPGVLSTSAHADVVTVDVVHDDGSLQAWVDSSMGEDRVEVRSALVPR